MRALQNSYTTQSLSFYLIQVYIKLRCLSKPFYPACSAIIPTRKQDGTTLKILSQSTTGLGIRMPHTRLPMEPCRLYTTSRSLSSSSHFLTSTQMYLIVSSRAPRIANILRSVPVQVRQLFQNLAKILQLFNGAATLPLKQGASHLGSSQKISCDSQQIKRTLSNA